MRLFLLALALLAAGCIEQSPLAHQGTPRPADFQPKGGGSSDATASAAQAPSAPQAPAAAPKEGKAQAIFDNSLEIAAYKIDPPAVAPGGLLTVTTYLKVLATPANDDMMFVHVDDAQGQPVRVHGDHWPAGHKVPMTQWKPGQVIEDRFQVRLNGFGQSNAAIVWVGFYNPQSQLRMTITNADKVKTDGNNRFALVEVPITH